MDYAALKTEIALPAYDGLSDADIAAALNEQTVAGVRDVPTADARGLLLGTGEWGALVLLARSTTAPQEAVAAAITAEDTLRLTETLEVTKPAYWQAVQVLTSALVTAGVLSSGTRDALLAMRDVSVPIWPVVLTEHDVAAARALET